MDMIVLTNWRLSVNVKWNNKFEKFADTRDSFDRCNFCFLEQSQLILRDVEKSFLLL